MTYSIAADHLKKYSIYLFDTVPLISTLQEYIFLDVIISGFFGFYFKRQLVAGDLHILIGCKCVIILSANVFNISF